MIKPTLHDFELTDSEYKSYKALPKKLGDMFINVCGIIVVLISFFLAYDNSKFDIVRFLSLIWFGLIIETILGLLLSAILGNLIMSRHKLHSQVSVYEAALLSYQRTQKEYWKSLKGKYLEKEIGNLFSSQGYTVEFTPPTNDEGIDIILRKENTKIIVQCKGHLHPVGPAVIRDLYGTLIASKADLAILVSTSEFTKGVYTFSQGKRIQLMSLEDIIQLSEQLH